MPRYLVYYDKIADGGITAVDHIEALRKARLQAPRDHRKHLRVRRVWRDNSLLAALARQKEYGQ